MTGEIKPPALDPVSLTPRVGSGYPAPFAEPCMRREKRVLGEALGLRSFGVNMTTLAPGAWSAQRHWHAKEDEFVFVVSGELTLVTDAGEQVLGAGMVAGFPAGVADGHHLVNRSDASAVYLEVGDRHAGDSVVYPDIDLLAEKSEDGYAFTNRKGEPY